MKTTVALLMLSALSGCAETANQCCLAHAAYPAPPQPPPPPPPAPSPSDEPASPSNVDSLPSARILVLQSTHTDRLTEVVGVIDVHAEMGGHDAALEVLKMRAAQLGADAVLGVEFHHGHGEEEPTHLSGLAVRFIDAVQ